MENSDVVTQGASQKREVIFRSVIPHKTCTFNFDSLPDIYKCEILKAAQYLKNEGCKEVYLFGSLVTGKYHNDSDVDLGVTGVPAGKYLALYADLMLNMHISFDLLNFEGS